MPESQNIEYKSIWKDEYLKWICGFANAQGGKIYIGLDDNGKVVGLHDSKKLMEDIPNKSKSILGLIPDVNLHQSSSGDYIEIVVEPYPFPVNYKGQYFYRSGSTKQELKGNALERFLLQKVGRKWDAAPVPGPTVQDLKQETIDFFRKKASQSDRLQSDTFSDSAAEIMDSLQLIEGQYLKRAAILLFHPNPERYITGCFVKIGYFISDDELRYQDLVRGNLFEQIEKTAELLFSKYLKSHITYQGLNRVESPEYPVDAIREALLNCIAHKDYSGGSPIQISVYPDKLIFWNEAQFSQDWTVQTLLRKHPSKPFNPDIANALFRSGYIESWGRGTLKIINDCLRSGNPKPNYFYDDSGFTVEFYPKSSIKALEAKMLNERQRSAVVFFRKQKTVVNQEYVKQFDVTDRTARRDLSEMVDLGWLEKVGDKKSTQYRFTEQALAFDESELV
jgi:ATP-dependent DNA helicase RecG